MSPDRLLATCWATAGDAVPLPGRQVSPIPLPTRIAAAAAAGFTAFGLLDHDLRAFLGDSDLATLAAMLGEHGFDYVELEFLTHWWVAGHAGAAATRELLYRAAEVLDANGIRAHHVKVAADLDDTTAPDIDLWAERLHALAIDAAEHGTAVALEFMPFANVSTLDQAVAIARGAGHPAAGLCLDMWHVARSGADPRDLADVPAELILAVELDDGSAVPVGDPYDDTVLRRLLPGEGDFPVVDFAAALMTAGWASPWGVEILSAKYRVRPLDEALPDVVSTSQAVLAAARERVAHAPGS
ncbi:MAG: sugar phosphate isomerase/epimerase family protein [Candidatus Nanopelagicales bacterium]